MCLNFHDILYWEEQSSPLFVFFFDLLCAKLTSKKHFRHITHARVIPERSRRRRVHGGDILLRVGDPAADFAIWKLNFAILETAWERDNTSSCFASFYPLVISMARAKDLNILPRKIGQLNHFIFFGLNLNIRGSMVAHEQELNLS